MITDAYAAVVPDKLKARRAELEVKQYMRYIRKSMDTQSCASVPPAPACNDITQNREMAMTMLKSKLVELKEREAAEKAASSP